MNLKMMRLLPLNNVSDSHVSTNYRAAKVGDFFTVRLQGRFVFVRVMGDGLPRSGEQLTLF